jgi:hypothetical protein
MKMVNKRNILTAVGIVLSFAIAIGGWVLTSHLIERNSERLLSMTLTIATNTLDGVPGNTASEAPYIGNGNFPLARPTLTENEMVSILRNWGADGQETPHEPTREQLNMEQAIEAGREWLSFVGGLDMFPDGLFQYRNVRAYLFQNLPPGQGRQFLPPAYSYWAVTFTGEAMNISMAINALTGQVWETEINVSRVDIAVDWLDIASALSAFLLALGISQDGRIILESGEDTGVQIMVAETNVGTIARMSEVLTVSYPFAGGNAGATVTATGRLLEDGERILRNMSMRLTD